MQTVYTLDVPIAFAGLCGDNGFKDVVNFTASEQIYPGRLLELDRPSTM